MYRIVLSTLLSCMLLIGCKGGIDDKERFVNIDPLEKGGGSLVAQSDYAQVIKSVSDALSAVDAQYLELKEGLAEIDSDISGAAPAAAAAKGMVVGEKAFIVGSKGFQISAPSRNFAVLPQITKEKRESLQLKHSERALAMQTTIKDIKEKISSISEQVDQLATFGIDIASIKAKRDSLKIAIEDADQGVSQMIVLLGLTKDGMELCAAMSKAESKLIKWANDFELIQSRVASNVTAVDGAKSSAKDARDGVLLEAWAEYEASVKWLSECDGAVALAKIPDDLMGDVICGDGSLKKYSETAQLINGRRLSAGDDIVKLHARLILAEPAFVKEEDVCGYASLHIFEEMDRIREAVHMSDFMLSAVLAEMRSSYNKAGSELIGAIAIFQSKVDAEIVKVRDLQMDSAKLTQSYEMAQTLKCSEVPAESYEAAKASILTLAEKASVVELELSNLIAFQQKSQ